MSLIQAHWVVLGGGALMAAILPVRLISADRESVAVPPPAEVTEVNLASAAGLSYALTAPPFTDGRIAQPAASAAAAAPAPAMAAPPQAPPPALVGVAVASRGRAIALARGSNGETLTLSRGEAIDGWRVVAIGRDRATFEREGARHTAQLDFANRTNAASPSPAPSSAPAVPAFAPAPPLGAAGQAPPPDRNPS